MGFLGDVAGGLVSSIPLVGPQISSALGLSKTPSFNLTGMLEGLGSDYIANEVIGKPMATKTNEFNAAEAKKAYERELDTYSKRYQITMADMKKAGLNPILAASGGFNVGSGVSAPAASGVLPHTSYGGGTASALSLSKSKESEAGAQEKIQRVKNLKKEIDLILAKAKAAGGQTALYAQQVKESLQRVVIGMQTWKKLKQETKESKARTLQHEAQAQKLVSEINQLNAVLPKLQAQGKVYKGVTGQAIAYLKEIASIIGIPLGLIGGAGIAKGMIKKKARDARKTIDMEKYFK